MKVSKRTLRLLGGAAVIAALGLVSTSAEAAVVREGAWPADEPRVSLELGRVTRGEALRQLAEEAQWSLVVDAGGALDDEIVLVLRDVPASAALDAILASGDWTATRDGGLLRLAPRGAAATAAPAPSGPPAPPAEAKTARHAARDITVTGESVRVAAGETVGDVTVMGGQVDVEGHVTGDLAVVGGSARIHRDARVDGDANAIGGSITIDEGAVVEGEVHVVGGIIRGSEHARSARKAVTSAPPADQGVLARAGRALSSAVSNAALLFVFGAVLIALAGDRFDQLRGEIAARPMKSIARGLVGGILSLIALVIVTVTIIGIPFAAVGFILFMFAVFAGTAAAATTAGAAIAGHRVRSAYGHLAVGCALYLVAGLLPWIGGWLQMAMVLGGYGAIVATRGAGLIRRKPQSLPPGMPYR